MLRPVNIHDVRIMNWHPPGDNWWREVEARPNEPLIEATMAMTLSWAEYRELLDKSRRDSGEKPQPQGEAEK